MIRRIIIFSATNRVLTIFLVGMLIIVSLFLLKDFPVDAIPDLSDTQVIVFSKWDRSPDIIEDQVTYPIISALLGLPKVKVIRGFSDYGFSYIYIIFEDGTDIYWARSRVLEYLSKIQETLPAEVKTELGPDATGIGWVFQYALVDTSGKLNLAQLRTLQDFKIKYILNAVPGVTEVASLGGFKKQYQIELDPYKLMSAKISLSFVLKRIKDSNEESGGRLLEISGAEYMIRGKGYLTGVLDIENINLGSDEFGSPILLKHIARISEGPDLRRGISDLDGQGDTVSGIVVMRHNENAMAVIGRIKKKLQSIESILPPGVKIITTYDRSVLISHAIEHLKLKLVEELIIVSLVIMLFLWHFPSAIIPILTIPISVLLTFIPLFIFGINANIMSLAGIAISIGVLVDGAIVEVENAYKKLEIWEHSGRKGDFHQLRLEALLEVAPSVFFSLLVIAVAFMPIFTLVDQEGRLFKPLAFTKNLSMLIAAILAVTFDPAVRMLFTRMEPFHFKNALLNKVSTALLVGKYYPEEKHPVSKVLFRYYEPVCRFVLKHSKQTVAASALLVLLTIPIYFSLGSEFMPPLYEESFLYMPTTMPGISVSQAEKLLLLMDQKLMEVPEVERVMGKSGRADTSTDPAPFSMMENVILLKPKDAWRKKERFYSSLPFILQIPFRPFFPDRISKDDLIQILDQKLKIPGVSNAWTMPIKARIDMLSTGMRTPIGIKVQGESLEIIEKIGLDIERVLKDFPGVRSVFAERTTGGYFLDININRDKINRYGLSVSDVQEVIMSALGGKTITETIEGRERYSVNVRYARGLRDSVEKIKHILVPISKEGQIPLAELADVKIKTGPGMIRNENGFLTGYVYVDTSTPDIGGFVDAAKKIVNEKVQRPQGYDLIWSGQFENMLRVRERLKFVLPLTLVLIYLLLYANTKSNTKTLMIMTAVPFSMIGAIVLLWFLDYQISIAVWVGLIALMGLDAETGVFMLMYLDLSYNAAKQKKPKLSHGELHEAIIHGAVGRIRPKMMTVLSAFMGLLPIMWSDGAGSDMMKRIAAPMVGGLFTSFLLELLVYPAIFYLWKKKELI